MPCVQVAKVERTMPEQVRLKVTVDQRIDLVVVETIGFVAGLFSPTIRMAGLEI